jgi:hypothetical protein
MSEVKFFELRDAMTFMPVMAVRPDSEFVEDRYLLARAGFQAPRDYVLLIPLERNDWTWDHHVWRSRTLAVAHEHLLKFWDETPTGSVIDVEFLLGLRDVPKLSERVDYPL